MLKLDSWAARNWTSATDVGRNVLGDASQAEISWLAGIGLACTTDEAAKSEKDAGDSNHPKPAQNRDLTIGIVHMRRNLSHPSMKYRKKSRNRVERLAIRPITESNG